LKVSLEKGREALENHLANWKRLKHYTGNIIIVYDGQEAGSDKKHGFEYIFTSSHDEADDRIIRIIRDHKNPKDVIVVSDDNKVRNNCRALGVKVMPVSYLLIERSTKNPKKSSKLSEKPVSPSMRKITDELKKEWGA
jgi:predicted RNA-binding protein with PIN domain